MPDFPVIYPTDSYNLPSVQQSLFFGVNKPQRELSCHLNMNGPECGMCIVTDWECVTQEWKGMVWFTN